MDIIRDAECITSQSTQSREPQKVSKTVGFESEEISKLKKDIEAIDSLIEDKKSIIKANEDKWYYKHYKKLRNFLIGGLLGMILSVPLLLILTYLNVLPIRLMFLIMISELGLYCPVAMPPAVLLDKAKLFSEQNNALSMDIEYLVAIKKQKLTQIQQLQQINYSKKRETDSQTRLSKIEIYQEVLKVLQDIQEEPSMETIEQVKRVIEQIEEKGKQKTLGTK